MPRKQTKKVVKTIKRVVKKVVKKEETKVEEVQEEVVPEVKVAEEVAPEEEVVKPLPVYKGKQVTGILSEGHTKEFYHCAALDGGNRITLHIPRDLF